MIILDLDGTISDDRWRLDRIDYGIRDKFHRYHPYHSLCLLDEYVNRHIVERHAMDEIIILTARPEWYRPATKHWLHINDIPYTELIMRGNDNHDPSDVLKANMISCLTDIDMAYDDNVDVYHMYLTEGINTELITIL